MSPARARGRTCTAVVLRRQDWRESSRIVTMITREFGRRSFLAKGAHRPKSSFMGALDALHVVEAKVRVREGRGLQNLDSVRVIQGNHPFRRDRARYELALHLTEVVQLAMPEGRADEELFDIYRGGLALYRSAPARSFATVATALELRVLAALGVLPELDRCTRSGEALPTAGLVGFSEGDRGFVQAGPGVTRRVSARAPVLARALLATPGRALVAREDPPADTRALFACVHDLLWWELGERPRCSFPEYVLR